MPRLESVAKAGYYPTPDAVVGQIARRLKLAQPLHGRAVFRVLDPCCGTGAALHDLAGALQSEAEHPVSMELYGVEVNQGRAEAAMGNCDRVLASDLFNTSIAHDAFSLLYLNPPYDFEVAGSANLRTEVAFLNRATPYLLPVDGILVYIVPRLILKTAARTLASCYDSLTCWPFPQGDREDFDQVVLMGQRKLNVVPNTTVEAMLHRWVTELPKLDDSGFLKQYPTDKQRVVRCVLAEDILFSSTHIEPQVAAADAAARGLWASPALHNALWPVEAYKSRPMMPLRQGHVAMLTAAGFLDNTVLESNGNRILVKGRAFKEYEIIEETEEKIVRQERLRTSVTALDLNTGELRDIKA